MRSFGSRLLRGSAAALGTVLVNAVRGFSRDQVHKMAAILAFYSILAAGPLLVVLLALVDAVWGPGLANSELLRGFEAYLGEQSTALLRRAAASSRISDSFGAGTAASVLALIFGATLLFAQLQASLAIIWRLPARRGRVREFFRMRLLALVTILAIELLILISIIASSLLSILRTWTMETVPSFAMLWLASDWLLSWLWFSLLVALIFRTLSERAIAWRDIVVGASAAALLFLIGRELMTAYLSRTAMASVHDAAGALATITLWVYYSSMTLLMGAEYARSWAEHHSRWVPAEAFGRRDSKTSLSQRGWAARGEILREASKNSPFESPEPRS